MTQLLHLQPQRRMNVHSPYPTGYALIRVWHRKGYRKGRAVVLPRYLLKCGCCDKSVEVFYDNESLEINGVQGSIQNWRKILLPLLGLTRVPKKKK